MIQALLANARGDSETAVARFGRAAAAFDAAEMPLYAAVARTREGELLGGSKGQALREAAAQQMSERRIRNPGRIIALYSPILIGKSTIG